MSHATRLDALPTPALILDAERLDRNLARLSRRMSRLGVTLRPHMKTAKSIDVARRAFPDGPGPSQSRRSLRPSTSPHTASGT